MNSCPWASTCQARYVSYAWRQQCCCHTIVDITHGSNKGSDLESVMQVVFMKQLIAVLQQPPSWLKFPIRFGTYFLPVDKRRAPSTKLPRLFDQ